MIQYLTCINYCSCFNRLICD